MTIGAADQEGFEWDPAKAELNRELHGVTFEEASTVLDDEQQATRFDETHSDEEDRFQTIGRSEAGRLLVVAWTPRTDAIRIISARLATRAEGRQYVEGAGERYDGNE